MLAPVPAAESFDAVAPLRRRERTALRDLLIAPKSADGGREESGSLAGQDAVLRGRGFDGVLGALESELSATHERCRQLRPGADSVQLAVAALLKHLEYQAHALDVRWSPSDAQDYPLAVPEDVVGERVKLASQAQLGDRAQHCRLQCFGLRDVCGDHVDDRGLVRPRDHPVHDHLAEEAHVQRLELGVRLAQDL